MAGHLARPAPTPGIGLQNASEHCSEVQRGHLFLSLDPWLFRLPCAGLDKSYGFSSALVVLSKKVKAARAGLVRQRTPLQGARDDFLRETSLTAVLHWFLDGSTQWLSTGSAGEPTIMRTFHLCSPDKLFTSVSNTMRDLFCFSVSGFLSARCV